MILLNGGAAYVVYMAVASGERMDAERHGKIVVSSSFLDAAKGAESVSQESSRKLH